MYNAARYNKIVYNGIVGVIHTATATLAGVGTLAGISVVTFIGKATLAGVGTLASIGVQTLVGKATLAGVGTLSAVWERIRTGAATLSGVGTLAGISVVTFIGKSTLAGVGTLASIGVITAIGKVTLAGVGTLATLWTRVRFGTATLAGVGTLASLGYITAIGKATLSGVGTLASSGVITAIGKALLAGVGTLAAIGRAKIEGLSDYMEDAIINFMRAVAFPSPAPVYVALFTSESGVQANNPTSEVSGGSYARQAVTLNASSDGATENSADVEFPKATDGWGSIVCAAFVDHETNTNWGVNVNVLMSLTLVDNHTIESGDRFLIPAGDLDVSVV